MNESHDKLEAIFAAAVELSAAERANYLDEACAGDAGLRRQVERLLRSLDRAGGFLTQAHRARHDDAAPTSPLESTDCSPGQSLTEKAGDMIGRYKLLEQLGEGGFGVVYMAEQREPVKRRVALKIIKIGMDTREVVARFEAERQALALMDHPNIAKVHDGGATGTGRPYFVMELVRGIRITDYCNQNQSELEERLKLFMQVCQAVQHAHQKGIIHRDLKPSNVLVSLHDGVPVPKVIDFGIAKATQQELTEKTLFTQFHQFIGTPSYMSPEQAEFSGLDIDTRSDIYSLGVLLYELLAGTTPFDGQQLLKVGLDEMRRTLREVEPPRPSTRLKRGSPGRSPTENRPSEIDADLDWIVMKCLEKDRTRRYETATGLAADIQRHLSNEPVVARPPSAAYRFQKMVRRNRVAFAATGAAVASLIVGLAVSTWLFIQERTAYSRAVTQQQRAEGAEKKAGDEAAIAKAVNDFLQWDLLSMADTASQADEGWRAKPDLTVVEALDRAAQRAAGRFKDNPVVEAGIRHAIGIAYKGLGDPLASLPHLERALELRTAGLGPNNPDTIDSLWQLGVAYHDANRFKEAIPVLEKALRLSQAARPTNDPATLKIQHILGSTYQAMGQLNTAISWLEDTLRIAKANAARKDLNGRMSLKAVGECMIDLGNAYSDAGRRAEARSLYEEGLKVLKANTISDHPNILIGMQNLAVLDLAEGNTTQAATRFEEILQVRKIRQGLEHPDTLETIRGLAFYYGKLGRTTEAEALHRESLEITGKLEARKPDRTIRSLVSMGNFFEERNRFSEAEPFYREALHLARKAPINDAPTLETRVRDLADSLYRQGKYAEAEPLYREAIQSQTSRYPTNHDNVLGTTASLARLLADWAWVDRTTSVTAVAADGGTFPSTSEASTAADETNHRVVGSAVPAPWQRAIEAERLLRECVSLRVMDKRVSRGRLGDTQSRLGAAVLSVAFTQPNMGEEQRNKRIGEAETLLLAGQELLEQSTSIESKYKRDSLKRLVRLYTAWPKATGAAEWKRKLETFDQSATENAAQSTGKAY